MRVDLFLRACANLKQSIIHSALNSKTQNELNTKVDEIAQKALDPSKQRELEETLGLGEYESLREDEAQTILFSKLCNQVTEKSPLSTRTKIQEVAESILQTNPHKATSSKKVRIDARTSEGATVLGSKKDLLNEASLPPFSSNRALQDELHRTLSPEGDFNGEFQDLLIKLSEMGFTNKKEILELSDKKLVKLLKLESGPDKTRPVFLRQAIIDSLKTKHQKSLGEDLNACLKKIDAKSLELSSPTLEGFLKTKPNKEQFDVFVKKTIQKGYDPSFRLSNSPIEEIALKTKIPQKILERFIFEARIEAFSQNQLVIFQEKTEKQQEDLQTPYSYFFDALVKNYAAEKKERMTKEDLSYVSYIFQNQVNRLIPLVAENSLDASAALKELKKGFFMDFEDKITHKESLTPEEFSVLPPKSFDPMITKKLKKEISQGTWKQGQEKEIEIKNISEIGAKRLRENISAILSSPAFLQASTVFFTKIKT